MRLKIGDRVRHKGCKQWPTFSGVEGVIIDVPINFHGRRFRVMFDKEVEGWSGWRKTWIVPGEDLVGGKVMEPRRFLKNVKI